MASKIVSKSNKKCTVDGCFGAHKAKGLCNKHYRRKLKHGTTDKIKRKRRLVCGVGENDANYTIHKEINGKRVDCPFYGRWAHMISRCYSSRYQSINNTYIGCTVIKEWLIFSNFKAWMVRQDWEDRHLDKDILVPENKIYSPDTCIFIPQSINKLLNSRAAKRGKYPQGVSLDKRLKKYVAQITIFGKKKHIGYFDSVSEAEQSYWDAKINYVIEVAMAQSRDLRIALIKWSAYKRIELESN